MKKIQIIFLAIALFVPMASFAATFNNHPQDRATLRAVNTTTNPSCGTCWATSVSANPGNNISFSVYYHNTGPDTATNVRVKLVPQTTGQGNSHVFTATVSADNAPAVTGSVTVTLSSSGAIDFVPGSVLWRANQTTSGSKALPSGQTGNEIVTSAGLNLGDIAAGGTTQGSVLALFKVSNTTTPPASVPEVSTYPASNISTNSATLNGYVNPKTSTDTVRWFEWGLGTSLGNSTSQVSNGTSVSNFSATISGLSQNSTYSYRAVARNAQGTVYGSIMSFTTTQVSEPVYTPSVSTYSASAIDTDSATLNGHVNPRGSTDTVRWFEWGTSTSLGNSTSHINQGSGTSNFSAYLSGLAHNTTYYYRAVARNAQGTVYGATMSFTTEYSGGNNSSFVPTVSTRSATGIGYDFAVLHGYVDPRNSNDTVRWFQWGTSSNLGNSTAQVYQGSPSDFSVNLSGLAQNTTYYYRAVARNAQGTVYGTTMSFSTNYNNNNQDFFVPVVSTRNADVSSDFAVINGYVDPRGSNDTTRWFEWGSSSSLGNSTPRLSQGSVASNFSATLSSLAPNTTYYYRAMARNSEGTVYGNVLSFTTNNNNGGGNNNGTQVAPTAITTLATEISAQSARLNSLIFSSSNQNSNAWFEWGTNTSLGNKTQTVNIGSAGTVRHTDVITGLSGGVTYYYRAVAENQYGKSYGTIFSFVVNTTTYTPPQNPPTVIITNPTRPTTPRPPVVVVNPGTNTQSLISLSLDGGAETIGSNEERTYRVSWKNDSNQTLRRVALRVVLPSTMNFKSASTGSFSSVGNILTIDAGTLTPGAIGEASVTAVTQRNLEIGTLLVVTVNLVYTDVKGAQGDAVAYVMHRVESANNGQVASPFNADSFLPTTLFEWMILLILLLLLVLLGNHLYGRFSGAKH